MRFSRIFCQFSSDFLCNARRYFSVRAQNNIEFLSKLHCYNTLFPWTSVADFSEYLASTIVYNKDGLIALNKPFGIKSHSYEKLDARPKGTQSCIVSPIPECNLTIEDSLESLKHLLNVPNLNILKSAERFTSGIVLLSTNEKTTAAVKKSFNIAKNQKRPHLTHWILTLGYPVVNFREEKVALKFLEAENEERKQPIIVTEFSKNEAKFKKVYTVHAAYRILSVNPSLATSLVEISTSSVKWHFVRVYASGRIASILGDALYSNRMNTFLGMPVKLHIEQAMAFNMPPVPENMAKVLNICKGVDGHSMIPTMLHLRGILLPLYKGEDLAITAKPPMHFQWTAEQLGLCHHVYNYKCNFQM